MSELSLHAKQIRFRYSISYLCLFRVAFRGQAHNCAFNPLGRDPVSVDDLPKYMSAKADFVALNDLKIEQTLPRIRSHPDGLLYALNQVPNYYIDLGGTFENYLGSLSSKTRSTLKRKARKFAELGGGRLDVRVYQCPEEMGEYHRLA